MSEKIPITLQNSDLFLNLEFTNINKNKLNLDSFKSSISKKGQSITDKNKNKPLYTSYLLPPLQISTNLNKTITSYIDSSTSAFIEVKKRNLESGSGRSQTVCKNKVLASSEKLKYKIAEARDTFPLKYELCSSLTPLIGEKFQYNKAQVEFNRNCYLSGLAKTKFWYSRQNNPKQTRNGKNNKQNEIVLQLDSTKNNPVSLDFEVITTVKPEHSLSNRIYYQLWSTYLKTFFEKVKLDPLTKWIYKLPLCKNGVFARQALPSLINSGISREFLLVAINLILFSILAVVQRNNYGKGFSPIISMEQSLYKNEVFARLVQNRCSERDPHTTLCTSKIPNISTSYKIAQNFKQSSWQYLNQIKPGYLNFVLQDKTFTVPWQDQKQEQFVGVFLKQTEQDSISRLRRNKTAYTSDLLQNNVLARNSSSQLTNVIKDVIQPWYCIKACNISNNQIVATRSVKKTANNGTIYENHKIKGFQYYIPYYTSPERIFAENDTIPSKREATFSKAMINRLAETSLSQNSAMPKLHYAKTPFLQGNALTKRSDAKNEVMPIAKTEFLRRSFGIAIGAKLEYPEQSSGQLSSSITLSQSVLKRLFYKYGFLVISPYKASDGAKLMQKTLFLQGSTGYKSSLCLPILKPSLGNASNRYNPVFARRVSDILLNFCESSAVNQQIHTFHFIPDTLVRNSSVSGYKFPELKKKEIVYLFRKRALFHFYLHLNAPDNKRCFDGTKSFPKFVMPKLRYAKTAFLQGNAYQNKALVSRTPLYNLQNKVLQIVRPHRLQSFALFNQLLTQLTTPFRTFKSYDLISQVLSTGESEALNKSPITNRLALPKRNFCNASKLDNQKAVQKQLLSVLLGNQPVPLNKAKLRNRYVLRAKTEFLQGLDAIDLKMQYTQVNLDEIENAKDLFEKMGRDYGDYLRQPKDSLPALIISPSLEDDREIEEEGIQIFRKRDFIKNKNVKSATNRNGEVGQGNSFTNKVFPEDLSISKDGNGEQNNTFFLSTATPELPEKTSKFERTESKSEVQNHQFLVKNALRQAQEEIDSIAKKEEKGSEKDKQVIPPLTRLEALYTIRNREKKREQAKDFALGKDTASSCQNYVLGTRSRRSTRLFNFNVRSLMHFNLGKKKAKLCDLISEKNGVVKNTPPPLFEDLFLYSDKAKNTALKDTSKHGLNDNWIVTPWLFSKLGDADRNVVPVAQRSCAQTTISNRENGLPKLCYAKTALYKNGGFAKQRVTPTLCQNSVIQFAKQGFANCKATGYAETPPQQSICTDRKHSFFGEISLPAKILTAQEQKQIFQQKANPLLKLNANSKSEEKQIKVTVPVAKTLLCKNEVLVSADTQIRVPSLSTSKVPSFDQHNNFDSVAATVPFSLLSPLSISSKTNTEKQIGEGSRDIVPKVFTQFTRFQIGTKLLPESTPFKQGNRHYVPVALFKGSPPPIYSYENISQNRACQGSAPKIKGTPLGSPVSHRVWQPKRMEPSTFRVSPRSKSTPVVPRISQKDWKNMMKWQLKKHFFEEDKRLLPLYSNKNKTLKIKTINLYLPWISIKQGANIVNNQAWVNFLNKSVVDERLPLNEGLAKTEFLHNEVSVRPCVAKTAFWHNEVFAQLDTKLRFVTGKELYNRDVVFNNEWPLTRLDLTESNFDVTSIEPSNKTSQLDGKPTNYFRFPTQQTLLTRNGPVKKEQSPNSFLSTQSTVQIPKQKWGVGQKMFNESILFESVTRYSWLFLYTFVFVLMFKQLFQFVYQVGLKDVFIKFLNSDFGRTITSEEFRYSIQNLPLTEFYMPKRRLKELLGLEKNKVQLLEIVWFLRNNCQGRNGPRGILLVGPPGVENVSVVQAIAGEAEVPIIVQSLEKIAQDNEPQRQLEQLYMRAHKQAPCVLFLDQLDTIGARRDQLFTDKTHTHNWDFSSTSVFGQEDYNVNIDQGVTKQSFVSSGWNKDAKTSVFASQSLGMQPVWPERSSEEAETSPLQLRSNSYAPSNKLNVVLRLLTILDGITQSSGVVTVATAQDITKLDPALLRPKRFDRRIYLSLPNQQDRVHLLKLQTQSIGHIKEMPWDYLSLQTEHMSTADIKSAINYSLFRAVLKKSVHTVETLEYGIDCVKTLTDKRVEKT